jgi:hypothetical protein
MLIAVLVACGGKEDDDDTSADTPSAPLSEETFRDRYAEKWCERTVECNSDATCQPAGILAGNDTGCVFDLEIAEACLTADWPCTGPTDAEFPSVPLTCSNVWFCGEPTTTTREPTTTTTPAG